MLSPAIHQQVLEDLQDQAIAADALQVYNEFEGCSFAAVALDPEVEDDKLSLALPSFYLRLLAHCGGAVLFSDRMGYSVRMELLNDCRSEERALLFPVQVINLPFARRQTHRLAPAQETPLTLSTGETRLQGKVENISDTGARITLDAGGGRLQSGEPVSLAFQLPGDGAGEEELRLDGEIAWKSEGPGAALGVRFLYADAAEKERVRGHLNRSRERVRQRLEAGDAAD